MVGAVIGLFVGVVGAGIVVVAVVLKIVLLRSSEPRGGRDREGSVVVVIVQSVPIDPGTD